MWKFTALKASSFHMRGLQAGASNRNPDCNRLCLNNQLMPASAPVTARQHWTHLKASLRLQ